MFWWIFATTLAFYIKGVCGFANTLVFTTVLSYINNNISISPVELLLGYPTNIILVCQNRNKIKWSVCLPVSLLVLAGSFVGVMLLKSIDTDFIKIIFGAITIIVSFDMLLGENAKRKKKQSGIKLGIIGMISGLLCGLYGVGALLGAYMGKVADDTQAFKANICFVFAIENTFRIVLYSLYGIITLDALKYVLYLFPVMIIALTLGVISTKFLKEKSIKIIVIILLILSGLSLIISNL